MEFMKNARLRAKALEDPRVHYDAQEPVEDIELEDILQRMREEAGLSQADVAKRLGVTPPAVNRLEKRPAHASFRTLKRYALACGFNFYFYYK
ncbi:helix-turn-helix domain-containing protein [Edaphovirga cremea]|uniref:helix-turn-helix domain-containing protein n=1 Tax=Edaphovirga cremea TaxID=2267246 RepID=UPI00398A47F9